MMGSRQIEQGALFYNFSLDAHVPARCHHPEPRSVHAGLCGAQDYAELGAGLAHIS